MEKMTAEERINFVSVLSQAEQYSFVVTNKGSYIMSCIPDARESFEGLRDYIEVNNISSLNEAKKWFRENIENIVGRE